MEDLTRDDQSAKRVILLPIDDTQATNMVVDWVIKSFYKTGDVVHVMHVVPLPITEVATGIGFEYYPLVLDADPSEDLKHVAAARAFMKRRALDALVAAGIPCKVGVVHFLCDAASIGEAIVNRAAQLQADAVVMAKHNKGVLAHFFLGSSSDYVVKHAKAPVILLHPE